MKRMTSAIALILLAVPAWSAPPPGLRDAVASWAAPGQVARFQYVLVDLNRDETLDAVVYVSDPEFCGNGGCRLLTLKGTATGFDRIGDSGYVRKPIYLLKEVNAGWRSLAAVVGTGIYQDLRPIRFLGPAYRSDPIVRGTMELVSNNYEHVLKFEEYP